MFCEGGTGKEPIMFVIDIGPESSNRDSIVAIVELLKNTKFGKAVVVGV